MNIEDRVLTPDGTGFVFRVDPMHKVVLVSLDTAESEPKYQTFEVDDLVVLDN